MESINLGAVLFGLLLLLWLAYALPRTAARREVMGRARAAEQAEMSTQARDLSAAVHSRRTSPEVRTPMPQDRLLLRPADPTSRPRFDTEPGTRVDLVVERARFQRLLRVVLGLVVLSTVALTVLAVSGPMPAWAPVLSGLVLVVYLAGLRRAELSRRARRTRAATRARQERAERENARRREAERARQADEAGAAAPAARADRPASRDLDETAARAQRQVQRPGEWTPRPVPRPTYALRGEVDDLTARHAAHRRSVLNVTVPLESARVEELEAVDETLAPAQDLHLDEILERRRA